MSELLKRIDAMLANDRAIHINEGFVKGVKWQKRQELIKDDPLLSGNDDYVEDLSPIIAEDYYYDEIMDDMIPKPYFQTERRYEEYNDQVWPGEEE